MSKSNFYTLTSDQEVFQAVATHIQAQINSSPSHRVFSIALAGGSTPQPIYSLLTSDKTINWKDVHLFTSDERFVPPDHPDSNYHQIKESLLNNINIPSSNLHFPQTTRTDLESATKKYELDITKFFASRPPRLNLILLGIGPDGHTASIFPNSPETINPCNSLVIPVINSPKPPSHRLSFSYKLINQAKQVIIIVTGKSKSKVVQQIFTQSPNPSKLPVQGINLSSGKLSWYLDQSAASLLDRE